MSEQEKNTTPAQNAAPAAPKPPKIDNAALKKAAAALREENNPQNFNAVINLMMRGVFLAPAKIEIGENAPKPDENGRIQLPKDTKVTFALLKSGDGKSFFTAFTDAEELDKKLAERMRRIRRRRKVSQQKLSDMSGVSYGSIKRFETTGQISLLSLTKLAMALELADELRDLFTQVPYRNIQEVINESKGKS